MRRMPPSQSSLVRLVMSTALRPPPSSCLQDVQELLAARLIQGWRRPARTGHGPDGLEVVPDQQQPALCQQVLNRPPAVIWLHTVNGQVALSHGHGQRRPVTNGRPYLPAGTGTPRRRFDPGARIIQRRMARPPAYEAYLASVPAGGMGTPSDIAHAVSFLASEGAGFITGQRIIVDGGHSLGA
jgi:hypothetical protein